MLEPHSIDHGTFAMVAMSEFLIESQGLDINAHDKRVLASSMAAQSHV
jgi:hypothetical protein